jgi:hypothetical protein
LWEQNITKPKRNLNRTTTKRDPGHSATKTQPRRDKTFHFLVMFIVAPKRDLTKTSKAGGKESEFLRFFVRVTNEPKRDLNETGTYRDPGLVQL